MMKVKASVILLVFLCVGLGARAQGNMTERLCMFNDTILSPQLTVLFEKIYRHALDEHLAMYLDSTLMKKMDTAELRKRSIYCEWIGIQRDISCWSVRDSLICVSYLPDYIQDFMYHINCFRVVYHSGYLPFYPDSFALVRGPTDKSNNEEILFWASFRDLQKLLTGQEINLLLTAMESMDITNP